MQNEQVVKPWIVRRWWFVLLMLLVLGCLAYFGYLNAPWDFAGGN
jgi:hypothetical protein